MALTQNEREWIDCHFEEIRKDITDLKVAMAVQRVKVGALSAVFGLLGGSIPVAVMISLYLIKGIQ